MLGGLTSGMPMMEGRRVRRFGRGQTRHLLPLRVSSHHPNTFSCWYCDFKSSALNEPLFHFGRKHARWLRIWFSVGTGFSLTALLGVTMVLLWGSALTLHFYSGNVQLERLFSCSSFIGLSPWDLRLSLSFADVISMCISTMISVSAHEFGHAFAAARTKNLVGSKATPPWAFCIENTTFTCLLPLSEDKSTTSSENSEGIQIEYFAMFLAIVFPGALVAFNHDFLEALPRFSALRIYCAGIWHNAASCAVCALALFLLPLMLYPFYISSEGPMVLNVSSQSPLFGFLSPGDLIISLNGMHIDNTEQWVKMTSLLNDRALNVSIYSSDLKGFEALNGRLDYCVPKSLIEESKHIRTDNQTICPLDRTAFVTVSCVDSRNMENGGSAKDKEEIIHCLTAKDIVKFKKCCEKRVKNAKHSSSCACSEDETCLAPVQMPGLKWVKITYASPYISGCSRLRRNSLFTIAGSDSGEEKCGGTFVFLGDVITMAQSIQLTAYQPRWWFLGANFPNMLEKLLVCTFNVSLMLALFNSLPVYFLDGECILEMALCYCTFLGPGKRRAILQSCLLGGTLVSIIVLFRIFFGTFYS